MKKHNEGYVLPFVLVVLVVVCIVALSLMSAALGNLQRQQASIERMQAKYEAQGKIEKEITERFSGAQDTTIFESEQVTEESEEVKSLTAKNAQIDVLGLLEITCSESDVTGEEVWTRTFSHSEEIKKRDGRNAIEMTVMVTVDVTVTVNVPQVEWDNERKKYQATTLYTIDYDNLSYTSYTIEEVTE